MLRLLVVYKKSQLELYEEHDPAARAELEHKEPDLYERFVAAHEQNATAIEKVAHVIRDRGIRAEFVYRADHETADGFDLVVSVGGDGTLLDVSHSVFNRPLLGVISSSTSVGFYGGADTESFEAVLDQWLAGGLTPVELTRLQVAVNGTPFAIPVLNDLLYAAVVPAAVSRYVIRIGDREEEQKSSGIWISTAAGSSAAIRSAGGEVMEVADDRIQYRVREPYGWGGAEPQLLGGLVPGPIDILAKMRTAALYVDGHREQIWLSLGDRVTLSQHPNPLRLLGFSRE